MSGSFDDRMLATAYKVWAQNRARIGHGLFLGRRRPPLDRPPKVTLDFSCPVIWAQKRFFSHLRERRTTDPAELLMSKATTWGRPWPKWIVCPSWEAGWGIE